MLVRMWRAVSFLEWSKELHGFPAVLSNMAFEKRESVFWRAAVLGISEIDHAFLFQKATLKKLRREIWTEAKLCAGWRLVFEIFSLESAVKPAFIDGLCLLVSFWGSFSNLWLSFCLLGKKRFWRLEDWLKTPPSFQSIMIRPKLGEEWTQSFNKVLKFCF